MNEKMQLVLILAVVSVLICVCAIVCADIIARIVILGYGITISYILLNYFDDGSRKEKTL